MINKRNKISLIFGRVFKWTRRITIELLKKIVPIIIILILWAFLTLVVTSPLRAVYIFFTDQNNDTVYLTNIAFAMLIGISSVSFSWARAIDPNRKNKIEAIVKGGEYSLKSAILFLSASGVKYVSIHALTKTEYLFLGAFSKNISIVLFVIVFGLAVICFTAALRYINLGFLRND